MKTAEIQKLIFDTFGIETTISKNQGSMKNHTTFKAKRKANKLFRNEGEKFSDFWQRMNNWMQKNFEHSKNNYFDEWRLDIHNSNISKNEQ